MSKVTVTVIQADLHWENIPANLEMFSQKIAAIAPDNHVLILPEMFTTGFSMNPNALAQTMDGSAVTWMKATAAQYNSVVCGSLIFEDGGKYYNRFLWVQPNGEMQQYNKRHLFAYAGEHEKYEDGKTVLHTKINGVTFNCNICYDLRFPVWARQTENKYDVLLYVANWPIRRSHAWRTLLTARAIENQCVVIGVNRVGTDGNGHEYSGDTMIVDPLGEVLYHKANEEDSFTYEIDKEKIDELRTQLPFLKDADKFTIG